MNYNEKLQLIDQLALRLGWLMKALAKADYHHRMRDRIAFIHFSVKNGERELSYDSYVSNLQAASIARLLEPLYNKVRFEGLTLYYDYPSSCLILSIHDLPGGRCREIYGAELDPVLDFVDEIRIHEAFIQHEVRFFRETNTTPQHWRIDA